MKFLAALFALLLIAACSRAGPDTAQAPPQEQPIPIAQEQILAGTATAPYADFSQDAYDAAIAQDKVILLHFYAGWSPMSLREQQSAQQAFDELGTTSVVGFKVNYNDRGATAEEREIAKLLGANSERLKIVLRNGKPIISDATPWTKEKFLETLRQYS